MAPINMKSQDLIEKVRNASPDEKKLIEQILEAPEPVKQDMAEALAEIKKKTSRGEFLQYVVGAALKVSKKAKIAQDITMQPKGFETMVKVFTLPEAFTKLAPKDPLAAARLKGAKIKLNLLYSDGQPLKSEEVASLLSMTRQAVDKKRKNGQLLGISLGRRGYLYPLWQFYEGKVLPGLDKVLTALKEYDPWTQLMFFKTGDIRLDGATPLERLQAGDIEAVVWAAECYGKHGAA